MPPTMREVIPPGSLLAPESRVKVLLVEDNPADARLIMELLSAYGEQLLVTKHVTRLSEAEAAMEDPEIDLAVVDLSLPDGDGMETFERIQAANRDVPLLILSGTDDQHLAAKMVQAGAQDYLVKGHFDGRLLSRTMVYAVERNRTERRLAHESNLLHALLETVPDRIYFKDRESRFLRINPAMAAFFKLERCEDAIGKTDFDFFLPEHAQPAFDDEQEIMRTSHAVLEKVEQENLPDGRVLWAMTTKVPLRDAEGRVIGTMGITHNITKIKRMEEELAAERNLLRSVIDHIPDPIFVKDMKGRYLLDNVAHARELNVSQQEVIGRTTYDFFPKEDAEKFQAADDEVIASGEGVLNKEEIWHDKAQGKTRWLYTTKVPIRDPETNELRWLVGIRRDTTQQKEAEEKLKSTNVELSLALKNLKESSDQLRSIQLQLIEAEKMKSIGRLAAGVAHEVKNPLAIITMGIDYLEGQAQADPNACEILHEMRAAVQRADGVIRGLLDFSAPRQLEVTPQSLTGVVKRALVLVRGEMAGKKFQVEMDLPPDLPQVQIDRTKVEQVFVNLMTNAIHAMGEGGTLAARVYSKQLTGMGENIGGEFSEVFHAGDQVVVAEIDDTGSGIPEGKQGKIFDPFFTTKPTGKGTGLGLTVSRSIIDLHGGMIKIENRPEGGARATVMFRV